MTDTEHRKVLFAATYASVVGEYSLLVMPFIVGAMIDIYGISERAAGRIVSVQMLGMALSAVGASIMMSRLNKLLTIYIMTAVVVLANIACAVGSALPFLVAARFSTGLGEGALMAVAGSIAAATADPRKAFSIIGFAVAVAASVALVLTPFLVEWLGRPGTFWFLATFAGGLLLFTHWLKPLASKQLSLGDGPLSTDAGRILAINPMLALCSFGLFWAAAAGLWVYAERIGLHHGLTLEQIGFYLGIGQLGGIPGPLCVGWMAKRWRLPPIFAIAILSNVFGGLLFVFVPNGWIYCLAAALLSYWAMFLTPCFRTLMALLDRSGAVVAASVAFFTVGYGASPLLITFFLGGESGFIPVAVICSGLYILSATLVLKPARLIGRADVIV